MCCARKFSQSEYLSKAKQEHGHGYTLQYMRICLPKPTKAYCDQSITARYLSYSSIVKNLMVHTAANVFPSQKYCHRTGFVCASVVGTIQCRSLGGAYSELTLFLRCYTKCNNWWILGLNTALNGMGGSLTKNEKCSHVNGRWSFRFAKNQEKIVDDIIWCSCAYHLTFHFTLWPPDCSRLRLHQYLKKYDKGKDYTDFGHFFTLKLFFRISPCSQAYSWCVWQWVYQIQ